MVEEVKIENVGGTRPQLGVASEATLQALLDATTGTQRTERDRRRIQETYDRSVRDTTQSQGIFKKAVAGSAKAVWNFGKELAVGEDRVSNFADAVFGSTSMVSRLTRYLDDNIDTWRTLSSVGASFNNSIVDMISSAANSAMNIDSFTSMVRNNSEQLARFGTTATQGAKFLGEFSKDFRLGVGIQFLEMGFTIEDVNEGLIGFMALERQRSTAALRSDQAQQEAAAQYLLSLDKLAKVTGRQRKQIEDALAQQMQDAGIRSQINRLEGQARTNLQETLAFLDTELQGPLADGLKDLMDGVAQTDLGKALQSQVPGISEFAQRMFRGGASLDEVIDQLGTQFGPQLARMASTFTKAQLDQMRMSGGVTGAIAEILDSSYQLNQQIGKDAQAAAEEAKRREPLTAALGKFENAIIQLRKQFVDAFFDIVNVPGGLVDAFSDLGDFLMSWIEPGANSLTGFVPTIRGWIDIIFGPTGFVTRGVRAFTKYLREGGLQKAFDNVKEAFNKVKDWITKFIGDVETEGFFPTIQARFINLIEEVKTQWQNIFSDTGDGTSWQDRIGNYIKDILYGKEVEVREGPEIRLERQGGLIKTITDGFTKLFDKASTALINLIGLDTTVGADSYLDQIMKKIGDSILGKEVEVREGPEIRLERQGGLIKTITDGFRNLLSEDNEIVKSISDGFEAVFKIAESALLGILGVNEGQTLNQWFDTTFSNISTRFDEMMAAVNETFETFKTAIGFGDGQSLTQWFDETWASVKDTMTEISTSITSAVDLIRQAFDISKGETLGSWIDKTLTKLTEWKDNQIASLRALIGMEGSESFGDFVNRLTQEIQDKIEKQILDTLKLVDTELRTFLGMTAGQTFESYITDMIDTLTTTIIDIIENRIPALIEAAIQGARSALGGGTATAESIAAGETGLGTLADQGALTGAYQGLLSFGDIDRERFLAEAEGGIVEGLNRMFGNMLGLGMEDWFEQKLTTLNAANIRGDQAREEVMRGLQSYIDQNYTGDEHETMQRYLDTTIRETLDNIKGYRQGTNGFQDFGKGTLSMLHGTEAVVPRNTPAGELLNQFFNKQNVANTSITPTDTTDRNQSNLISKIDELNTTMSRVAILMEASVGVQTRTMQNIKGLGTDLYRGIPR